MCDGDAFVAMMESADLWDLHYPTHISASWIDRLKGASLRSDRRVGERS